MRQLSAERKSIVRARFRRQNIMTRKPIRRVARPNVKQLRKEVASSSNHETSTYDIGKAQKRYFEFDHRETNV